MTPTNSITSNQLTVYRQNFLKHGPIPQGTFQNNYETQCLRYERLLKNLILDDSPFSIHDVGAGIADLHRYLTESNIPHTYSGTEIVSEMAQIAKEKYPYISLQIGDFLDPSHNPTADFLVLSGVFNIPHNTPKEAWKDYTYQVIKKMYQCAQYGISLNFLTSKNTFSQPDLYYANPTETFEFCHSNLSRFINLDHAYPLYEFTITILKPNYLQTRFPSSAFDKYFPKY